MQGETDTHDSGRAGENLRDVPFRWNGGKVAGILLEDCFKSIALGKVGELAKEEVSLSGRKLDI